MKIKRVLLVGGTHGNELTGVYLLKKFEQHPELVRRPSFETLTLVGNPQAVAAGVRYVDQDLNRSFDLLSSEGSSKSHEHQRAIELQAQYGQDGQLPIDLIIDQHSTTSNAGIMLILDNFDPFTLRLAAHLAARHPVLKVYSYGGSERNLDSLRSIAKYRIGIEIGPIAHGTLDAKLFQENEAVIQTTLDYLETCNNTDVTVEDSSLTIYQYAGVIDYPRDESGEIQAAIHHQVQSRDYEMLNPGDPLFITFDGAIIVYQGAAPVHPLFIGEAAYLEKGIAMVLTEKKQIQIS